MEILVLIINIFTRMDKVVYLRVGILLIHPNLVIPFSKYKTGSKFLSEHDLQINLSLNNYM